MYVCCARSQNTQAEKASEASVAELQAKQEQISMTAAQLSSQLDRWVCLACFGW